MIRPWQRADADVIRRVAGPVVGDSRYRSAARGAVDSLIEGADPDARGLVAGTDDDVAAFIIYGTVAGSEGAGRLQLIVTSTAVQRQGLGRRLVERAVADLHAAGARFVLVELPDDPMLAAAASLLERSGFRIEARVRDFFRDGIDLALFRRDLPHP